MANIHDIMNYRQDLVGFGEPKNGMWDGFQRIDIETKLGGIIGVFKQGGVEKERKITINYLNPSKIYTIKEVNSEKIMIKNFGKNLAKTGFNVKIVEDYNRQLFEITTN